MPEKYRTIMPKGRNNEPKWLQKSTKHLSQNPCLKKFQKNNEKSVIFEPSEPGQKMIVILMKSTFSNDTERV